MLRKELRSLAIYNFDIVPLSDVSNERLVEVYASGVSAFWENSSTLASPVNQIGTIVSKLKELESNLLFINAVYSLPYFEKLRNEERMRTIGMSDLHIQYRRISKNTYCKT